MQKSNQNQKGCNSCGWNAVCLDGRDHALIKKHVEEFIGVNLNESKMWG